MLALVTGACGGGDDDAESPSATRSPSPSGSASVTTTPVPSSSPTTAQGYLPVPAGVTLTAAGVRLELKESALAAWLPRQDLVGVVDVAITRIDETTVQASLAGFDLKGDEQRSTPYFVRAAVTNVGDTDLGGRQLPIYLLDGRGVLTAPTGVARNFAKCPGSTLPGVFAPGDTTKSCLIFLVPKTSELQSIMFRPPEGTVPLQWTGKVTTPKQPGKKSGKNAGTKGGKSQGEQ
ncbi:hypothetical protein BH09ACT12_BH09ACT12_10780 [soil metagenome]